MSERAKTKPIGRAAWLLSEMEDGDDIRIVESLARDVADEHTELVTALREVLRAHYMLASDAAINAQELLERIDADDAEFRGRDVR